LTVAVRQSRQNRQNRHQSSLIVHSTPSLTKPKFRKWQPASQLSTLSYTHNHTHTYTHTITHTQSDTHAHTHTRTHTITHAHPTQRSAKVARPKAFHTEAWPKGAAQVQAIHNVEETQLGNFCPEPYTHSAYDRMYEDSPA
jgi:hypothetical protein